MKTDRHFELIECPECNTAQWATVEHNIPWNTFIHECENCKYIIMESEWNNILKSNES